MDKTSEWQAEDSVSRHLKSNTFIELVTGTDFPPLVTAIRERNLISALDLGCENGISLWCLYHDHGFNRLVGVERQQLAIDAGTESMSRNCGSEGRPIFELYSSSDFILDSSCPRPKLNSIEEFIRIFDYRLGTDIQGYLSENSEQFDVVICSNSLHFEDYAEAKKLEEVLLLIDKATSERGIIYIRVKEYPGTKSYRLFEFEEYPEIIQRVLGHRNLSIFSGEPAEDSNEGRWYVLTNID